MSDIKIYEFVDQVPSGLPLEDLENLRNHWLNVHMPGIVEISEAVFAGVIPSIAEFRDYGPGRREVEYKIIRWHGDVQAIAEFRTQTGDWNPSINAFESTGYVTLTIDGEVYGRVTYDRHTKTAKASASTSHSFFVPTRRWQTISFELLTKIGEEKMKAKRTNDDERRSFLESLLRIR